MPRPLKPCARCGMPLTGKPASIAKRSHCSQKCAQAARSEKMRTTRACEHCCMPFVARPTDAEQRFCSRLCANRWIMEQKIVQPARVVERQRGLRRARTQLALCCLICGWSEDVDACHIVPSHKGGSNELANVVMLCPNHHRMLDRGALTIEQIAEAQRKAQSTPASSSSA